MIRIDPEKEKSIAALLANRFNRWWGNQRIDTPSFKRRDFSYLLQRLGEPKAITLIGPRQVGKTTVVMQIIRELIESGKVPPKRVLYVQLDDIELRMLSDANLLQDILSVYQKYVLLEDLNTVTEDVYLFFDEVQRVPEWAEHVKALLAANKRIHILSTGSASFNISQKSRETLPGRQELYQMFPLKFPDALALYCSEYGCKMDVDKLGGIGLGMRKALEKALTDKSFSGFFEFCKAAYVEMAPQEAEIRAALLRYLSKGGYPEIVATRDPAACQKTLRGYASDAIVKDMMPWFRIRDFETAEKLMFLLASISGEQLNVQELLKRLSGSNAITVRNYIGYLQELGILSVLPVYSKSKLGSSKYPKVYFLDIGFRNAMLGILDAPISETERGHIAETVAHDHILRLAYKLNASSPGHVSFFLGKKGEVDFVIDLPRHSISLPIEIKFREKIDKLKGLDEFAEQTGEKMSIVVTADELRLDGERLFIPMWMFLLMC